MKHLLIFFTFWFSVLLVSANKIPDQKKYIHDCLTDTSHNLQNRADTLLLKAYCLINWARKEVSYQNGLIYAQEIEPVLKEVTDSNLLAEFFFSRADIYHHVSQFKLAIEDYKYYAKYNASKGNLDKEINGLISLAESNRAVNQFSMAKFVLNQALNHDSLEQKVQPKTLARLWHRYAAVVVEGDHSKELGIKYSNKSLSYSEPNNLFEEAATSYLELGYIYNIYDKEISEFYYFKALKIFRAIGNLHAEASVLKNLVRLYYNHKQFDKAEDYWKQSFEMCKKYKLEKILYELYDLREEYYLSLGDFKNAYLMNDSAHTITKRLDQSHYDREMLELGKKYQNEIALQRLTNSEIQRERALEAATVEKEMRNVAIGFLILVMAALAMLIYYYRQVQLGHKDVVSKNKIIEEQNRSLSEALEQKQALIKEVHHRVKNNLQIVMSILNMQSNNETAPEVKNSLGHALQRIRSISLIHDRLYQNDSLSRINFQDYLEELVHYLKQAVTSEKKKVHFKVECTDVVFNIDKAIPLGLLINEIVTNSIKYAFKDQSVGIIRISLEQTALGDYILDISDDGIGIQELEEELPKTNFGTSLINMLIRQLKANFDRTTEVGTHYSIRFNTDNHE